MIFTISRSSADGSLVVPIIVEVTQEFKGELSSALPLSTSINFRARRDPLERQPCPGEASRSTTS